MKNWIFRESTEEDKFIYYVEYLDEYQNTLPYSTEAYMTEKEAITRAKYKNSLGVHVRVVKELGFCEKL